MANDEITDEDIDQELERIKATANEPAYLLAEIFLSVDDASHEAEVTANMQRLRDAIVSGASFPGLARQFSQGAGAADGGDLGWIAKSQLPEDLKDVVPNLNKGELSQPLPVIGGVALVLMRDKRIGFGGSTGDTKLTVMQAIVVPEANETPDQFQARVANAAGELTSCSDFNAKAATLPSVRTGSPINIAMSDLQPQFLKVLENLPDGKISEPVPSDQGTHLLMICGREEQPATDGMPTRQDVRANLENQQFDLVSRGYLRDLRRAAFVDVRI
jgi:peptidyl-prolyl cis-trans isomerase SurA